MNTKDIIRLANDIKFNWHTNNPYIIAKSLGIEVLHINSKIKGFKARIVKHTGLPTTISINNIYTDRSKMILCAHELGHALLHDEYINDFAITSKNIKSTVELEANLFAIALLSDETINYSLSMPLEKMNNYLLKSIIDYNLELL